MIAKQSRFLVATNRIRISLYSYLHGLFSLLIETLCKICVSTPVLKYVRASTIFSYCRENNTKKTSNSVNILTTWNCLLSFYVVKPKSSSLTRDSLPRYYDTWHNVCLLRDKSHHILQILCKTDKHKYTHTIYIYKFKQVSLEPTNNVCFSSMFFFSVCVLFVTYSDETLFGFSFEQIHY